MKYLAFLINIFLVNTAIAGEISLVADLNRNPDIIGSKLYCPYILNDRLYYGMYNRTFVFDGTNSATIAYNFACTATYVYNNKAYLLSLDATLYVYDGMSGPKKIKSFDNTDEKFLPSNFTGYNNKLYFTVFDQRYGIELWVYDGINEPALVADIVPGDAGSTPQNLCVVNNKLHFVTSDGLLWNYDGINPPVKDTLVHAISPIPFAHTDTRMFFVQNDSVHGDELWEYNGSDTLKMVADLMPGKNSSFPENLWILKNNLYFKAIGASGEAQIWMYDGQNSPVEVNELYDLVNGSKCLAVLNNKLYYSLGTWTPHLWLYDGNSPKQIPMAYEGYLPASLIEFKDILYYSINVSHIGWSAWMFDGINPTSYAYLGQTIGSNPSNKKVFGNKLYFTASEDKLLNNYALWVYDGINPPSKTSDTAISGTGRDVRLIEMNNRLFLVNYHTIWVVDSSDRLKKLFDIGKIENPVLVNNKLYFQSKYSGRNAILAFDGKNLPEFISYLPPDDSGFDFSMAALDNKLYFTAFDSVHGYELWSADGNNPSSLAADINVGTASSGLLNITVCNNKLYFWASDGVHGSKLWEYNGISSPAMVDDLNGDSGFSYSGDRQFVEVNGKLYFIAFNRNSQRTIYEYDGTHNPENIFENRDNQGTPGELYSFGNLLVFELDDQVSAPRLWEYNGNNTKLLIDADSVVDFHAFAERILTSFNNNLIFTGSKLWKYDGRNQPVVVSDNLDNTAEDMVAFNNKLYFSANQSDAGQELYVLSLPDTMIFASACGPYIFNGTSLTESGIYFDTIPGYNGSDSTMELSLKIGSKTNSMISVSACEKYTSPSGRYTWNSSGIYTDTIPNLSGCDSVITLDLHIDNIDTAVIRDQSVLISEDSDSDHQWIDCDNGNKPIDGETFVNYTAQRNGRYAVILTNGTCVDTSGIYEILMTGISDPAESHITLYPNPTAGNFVIDLGKVYPEVLVTITGDEGQIIRKESVKKGRMIDMKLDEPPGIYLVTVTVEGIDSIFRVVKR